MIKPYYHDEQAGITIYHDNSLELMAELVNEGISFIYGDPPYGINVKNNSGVLSGRQGAKSLTYGKESAKRNYVSVLNDETSNTARQAVKIALELYANVVQVWWGANHYSEAFPSSPCWIVWDKLKTGTLPFADCELAWCNKTSAVKAFRHQWHGMMKASERGQKRVHPTQKPVKLAEFCYQHYGKADDLILDPFVGSGSALLAAQNMGRRCIGIEAVEAYCEIAAKRLSEHPILTTEK